MNATNPVPEPTPTRITNGVLVIIPAYNEAVNIAQVVAEVRAALPSADVCVINDGSADETGLVAAATGAITINMPFNVGIGAAVQTGYLYAYRHAYQEVVRVDGDGQHPPEGIPALLAALRESDADIVIGSRFMDERRAGYQGTLPRRIGIRLLISVIGMVTGTPPSDPTSGFMAARSRAIEFCAHEYPHDYPEPELRVLMHRAGLRIHEVPVTMRERLGGVSSITTWRSVYYMSKVVLALLLDAIRMPRWPQD